MSFATPLRRRYPDFAGEGDQDNDAEIGRVENMLVIPFAVSVFVDYSQSESVALFTVVIDRREGCVILGLTKVTRVQ